MRGPSVRTEGAVAFSECGSAAYRGGMHEEIASAVARAAEPDERGLAKLRGQNKLTTRERIDLLADPGSFIEDALLDVVAASADLLPVLVVGAPLRYHHRIYNTAVVIHRGQVLGVAPKSYLPTYREFYERRQMAAGDDVRGVIRIGRGAAVAEVPFGPDLLFAATDLPGFVLHVEICEDMFVPIPPSSEAALAGATVLANLSGSPITIGRAEDRCLLARSASSRCLAAYVYAAAGEGDFSPAMFTA